MRAVAVLYVLGWVLALIAAAMLIPASIAVAADSIAQVQAFLIPAIGVGFLAGGMIIAFKNREVFAGRRQILLLLTLVWFIVPIAGALPFYTSGFPGNAVAAYFEATSGFTTTGATVLSDLSQVPASIIAWRALLQWIGGLVTLVALAALLGPLSGSSLLDRQLRLIGHSTQGVSVHIKDAILAITPLYAALTTACFIALSVSGIPVFDAFCLSLSTLSTGGFMPRDGAFVLYDSPMAELTLALFMAIGAISIIWIRCIIQMRWTLVREIREPLWIIWAILLFGLILAVMLAFRTGETSPNLLFHELTMGLASAASIISTSGFPISHQINALIPFLVLLGLCIIGGGRFSTAGGLKVYRIAFMLRQLGRELQILIYPHGVRPSRHGAEALDNEIIKATWVTFTAFILIIGIIAMIIASTGVPFAGALLASASSVSNIGPAYEFARVVDFPDAPGYGQMSPLAQIVISAGMIFGRVEILALLALFNGVFWRN